MLSHLRIFSILSLITLASFEASAIDIVLVYKWSLANSKECVSEDKGSTYDRQDLVQYGYMAVEFDTNTQEYSSPQILKYWNDSGNKWVTQNSFANSNSKFTRMPVGNKEYIVITGFNNNDSGEVYSGQVQNVKLETAAGKRTVAVPTILNGQSSWHYTIYNRIIKLGYGTVLLKLDKKLTNNANVSGQQVADVMRDLKNAVTTKGYKNQSPTAIDDSVWVEMNVDDLSVTVLSNDFDPQNSKLTVTSITINPTNGTATINADGTVSYVPNFDFFGIDQFSYEVANQYGSTDTATATITVTYNREVECVSVSATGAAADGNSYNTSISRNGRYVVFKSDASNLASGGSATPANIYRYDRGKVNQTGAVYLVNYNEQQKANMGEQSIAFNGKVISDNGANIAFASGANNLLDYLNIYDTNGVTDVFVRNITESTQGSNTDIYIETTVGVNAEGSIAVTNNSTQENDITYNIRPSTTNPDWVPSTYTGWLGSSSETIGGGQTVNVELNFNTVDPELPANDYYVWVEVYDATNRVTVNEYRLQLSISANPIVRISEDANGNEANGPSTNLTISNDAALGAFQSDANNLVANDTNGKTDVFVKDTTDDSITRVSVSTAGVQSNGDSECPSISGDGNYVVFQSRASNLVTPNTTTGRWHIYLRNRNTNTTYLISKDATGAEGDGDSKLAEIDGNGATYYITYSSTSTNLDANIPSSSFNAGVNQVYYYTFTVGNENTSTNTCISVSNTGITGNGDSTYPSLTQDGQYVVFESAANNLVTGDNNSRDDVFIRSIVAGTTSLISRDSSGELANDHCKYPSIGSNGNYLYSSFSSASTNLMDDDTNGYSDIFVEKQTDDNQ